MRIGEARLQPVIELDEFPAPLALFGSDLEVATLASRAAWLFPQFVDRDSATCRLSQHAWLIELAGTRILVDPCVGEGRHRPDIPFYHMIASPMLDRLAALGCAPEDVDYVFCTHLHVDHVGWNTRRVDGRYVPTFPNARYLFSRAEDAYWRRDLDGGLGPEDGFNAGIYRECVQPVIAAGLADLIEDGAQVVPGLRLIDAPGHTVGHMAGVLESGGEGAVLAGDAIHHPIQALFPEADIGHFGSALTWATRRRLLDLCADRDYWLAPAHFRAPHVCKVRRTGDGYDLVWPAG